MLLNVFIHPKTGIYNRDSNVITFQNFHCASSAFLYMLFLTLYCNSTTIRHRIAGIDEQVKK